MFALVWARFLSVLIITNSAPVVAKSSLAAPCLDAPRYSLSGCFPSDLLNDRPLGKSNLLSGYFPSDLLDGRPLGK